MYLVRLSADLDTPMHERARWLAGVTSHFGAVHIPLRPLMYLSTFYRSPGDCSGRESAGQP